MAYAWTYDCEWAVPRRLPGNSGMDLLAHEKCFMVGYCCCRLDWDFRGDYQFCAQCRSLFHQSATPVFPTALATCHFDSVIHLAGKTVDVWFQTPIHDVWRPLLILAFLLFYMTTFITQEVAFLRLVG